MSINVYYLCMAMTMAQSEVPKNLPIFVHFLFTYSGDSAGLTHSSRIQYVSGDDADGKLG